MSKYNFCVGCDQIKTKLVPGLNGTKVREVSCPARFNPMEGKWIPKDGVNPKECPRNKKLVEIQKQCAERRLR